MNKAIKHFIFALICILVIQLFFANLGWADDLAAAAAPAASETFKPDSGGMFNPVILDKMHHFMQETYNALGELLMVGHSLICYAIKVDYTCPLDFCNIAKFPNLNFIIVGLVIYFVGVLISMSVGMYFVDIAFKLGFAIVFMPVTIALWPFPPTKNKFTDNLSIIIRNAMLFMLVAIGVAFAITLIQQGLFEGGKDAFWEAIGEAKTEALTDSFSLFSCHILVVFFSIVYAFKILESSVNNYLNAFFNDAAFGSTSPMHMMGAMAVGMVAENLAKPALSYASDVATHQTGRALQGVGSGMTMMFSPEGRQTIKQGITNKFNKAKTGISNATTQTTHAILNPRETYNQAMQSIGQSVNKATHATINGIKDAHDIITTFGPVPARESWRQKQVNWVNEKLDKIADSVGNKLENTIAHGGGTVKESLKQGVAATGAAIHNMRNDADHQTTTEDVRASLHEKHEVFNAQRDAVSKEIKDVVTGATEAVKDGATAVEETLHNTAADVGQKIQNAAVNAAVNTEQKLHNAAATIMGRPEDKINADQAREKLQADAQTVKKGAAAVRELYNTADQAPISLDPAEMLKTTFRNVAHPMQTVRRLAQMPKNTKQALKDEGAKVILKKTGQVVFRSAKDAKKNVDKGGTILGNILQSFGKDLADNSKHSAKRESFAQTWQRLNQQKREAEQQNAAEAEEYRQMGDE